MHQNNNEGERVKQQREPQRHLVVKTISVIETKPSYSKFVTVNTDATPLISKTGTKIHQKHKKRTSEAFFFFVLDILQLEKNPSWKVKSSCEYSALFFCLSFRTQITNQEGNFSQLHRDHFIKNTSKICLYQTHIGADLFLL